MPSTTDNLAHHNRSLPRWWPEILTALLTIAVYARSLGFFFAFDDLVLVVHNPTIHSWRYLPDYFTRDLWQNVQAATGYYRPMILLWFRINDAVFGLQPAWWHLTNVLVHATGSVLVLRLARRITNRPGIAVVAGLLFAVHPVHVETVAWISDVVDALLTVFFVAGVLCFLRSRNGSRLWFASSVLCYGCAMLCKEPGFMLPAVLFLHVLIMEGRKADEGWARLLLRGFLAIAWYLPFSAIYLIARHHALRGFSVQFQSMTVGSFLLSLPLVAWGYARMLLVPLGLSPFYDLSAVRTANWHAIVLPLFGIVALAGLLWMILRREGGRLALFSAAWFVVTLAPALDLPAFPPSEMVHDRYIYLASVGFCILAALGLSQLDRRLFPSAQFPFIGAVVIAALAALAFRQQAFWRDDTAIFTRAVEIAPHNDLAESGLATIVARRGNYLLAISLFKDVLDRNPTQITANLNLGWTYFLMGDYADAERYLTAGAATHDNSVEAFADLGALYLKTGRFDLALASFQRAQSLSPPHPFFHEKISEVLEKKGDASGAIREMEIATQLAPADPVLAKRLNDLRARSQ